jgi:FkbM family methyltransferase
MKILYGVLDNYTDITNVVFQKCMTDTGIFIPNDENSRCSLIGYDPCPNVLKHILIIDDFKNNYIYTSTKPVVIKFNSISEQLTNAKYPKMWWNETGKFIQDPEERLKALQTHCNLHFIAHGGFEFEYPEQLLCMRHINENNKVLEIGGNIGRTAHIIQTILNNPKHHVIMECDKKTANELRTNLDSNNYTEVPIETAALSIEKLYMDGGHGPRPLNDFKENENPVEIETISYSKICEKYNISFDTLVADCEGSLFYIFQEDPDMLNTINTVIMENDYLDLSHKQMVDSILQLKGFKLVYQEKGVPWASWSCCYEYFYEVWKKD